MIGILVGPAGRPLLATAIAMAPAAQPAAPHAAPPAAVPAGSPESPAGPVTPGRGTSGPVMGAPAPTGPDAAAAIGTAAAVSAAVATALVAVATIWRRVRATPTTAASADATIGAPPHPADYERLLAGGDADLVRRDPRGSLATDRSLVPEVVDDGPGDEAADAVTVGTPVWVRRLDERIPVMPTIGTLPVDNDPDGAARRRREPRRPRGG